jgi:hypothetical protein
MGFHPQHGMEEIIDARPFIIRIAAEAQYGCRFARL